MLEHLLIRKLATIDELEIELGNGFTVLSGETGAGKSILIDALGLVLGTRADPALVRAGSDKAEIVATFRLDDATAAREWLAEHELLDTDDPATCVIRRVLQAEGQRTRAFINGSATAAAGLRELGERLVEVFGQNESHGLRLAEVQRELLDAYGGHAAALAEVAQLAREHREIGGEIERARAQAGRDPAQVDYLRFQVAELEALKLRPDELPQLEAEHRQLANVGRLIHDGSAAQEQLYGGDDAIHDRLAAVQGRLRGLSALHPGFLAVEGLVISSQVQAREAADELRRLLDHLDLDPERLAVVETRMADVHELARKHRVRAEDLPARHLALSAELRDGEHAGDRIEALQQQRGQVERAYRKAALHLGDARRRCAPQYSALVTQRVRELGMPDARFQVRIEAANAAPRALGDDEVSFDFSANPGQPPRALARVASGGELSRVSLAIQVVAQLSTGAPTMIFDEVDAGIGGGVAEAVGRQLRALGAQRQVLCVTHLGQVAAAGRQHLAVSKRVLDGQTYTRVAALDDRARVDELARMIGGTRASAATETMAREMLKLGQALL